LTISTFGLGRGEGRGGEGVGGGFFEVLRVGEGIWKENTGSGGVETLFLFFL
jgi:hypothetical protein